MDWESLCLEHIGVLWFEQEYYMIIFGGLGWGAKLKVLCGLRIPWCETQSFLSFKPEYSIRMWWWGGVGEGGGRMGGCLFVGGTKLGCLMWSNNPYLQNTIFLQFNVVSESICMLHIGII